MIYRCETLRNLSPACGNPQHCRCETCLYVSLSLCLFILVKCKYSQLVRVITDTRPWIILIYFYTEMATGNSVHDRLLHRLKTQFIVNERGCHVWTGGAPNSSGYGRMFYTDDGKKKQVFVHRAQYVLNHYGTFDVVLPPLLQISHKCHNKLCINIKHLSLEEAAVNMQRNTCIQFRSCTHHGQYGDCIL